MEEGETPNSPNEYALRTGRIRISWTRRGLILAGLGFALFLVGMWRVDGVMAAMGLSVAVLFAVAWISGRINLSGLALSYRGPRRVEYGKSFSPKLELTNDASAFDGFWIDFRINLCGEKFLSGRSHWIAGKGEAAIRERTVLRKRGLTTIHKGWLNSTFPLGLLRFSRELEIGAEIGVLPKSVCPHELFLSGQLLDGSPFGGARHSGGSGEWKGLRETRAGDGLRRIAWAASLRSEAAGGALLIREDEPPGSQAEGCMVIFHSYGGDRNLIRPDRFENALGILYGSLQVLMGWSMPVRWVADFADWREKEVRTRRQLAASREDIMLATRSRGTEAHDFVAALGMAGTHECVIVISDMPRAAWESFVPQSPIQPILVEISAYDVLSRKGGRM